MGYVEQRENLVYYKLVRNVLTLISRPEDSIIDIGSNGIDILSHLQCKEKVSLDLEFPCTSPGIRQIKGDFFKINFGYNLFNIACCLQVLEHIQDAKQFAQKLLSISNICIVSVPYLWPAGACEWHCQDPINEEKLISWFSIEPIFMTLCSTRLIAIFMHNSTTDALYQVNKGNFRDFCTTSIDIDKNFKITPISAYHNILGASYKEIQLQKNNCLLPYAMYSAEELVQKSVKRVDHLLNDIYDPFFLFIGRELYPFYLDSYGHPFFLKETIRYLCNNGRFAEAEQLLANQQDPSVNIVSTKWSNILFYRAYEFLRIPASERSHPII